MSDDMDCSLGDARTTAKRPSHTCMCFPKFNDEGDIIRCEECGQHHLALSIFREWTAISPRKARRLMRRYAREQRQLDDVLAGGPYPTATNEVLP